MFDVQLWEAMREGDLSFFPIQHCTQLEPASRGGTEDAAASAAEISPLLASPAAAAAHQFALVHHPHHPAATATSAQAHQGISLQDIEQIVQSVLSTQLTSLKLLAHDDAPRAAASDMDINGTDRDAVDTSHHRTALISDGVMKSTLQGVRQKVDEIKVKAWVKKGSCVRFFALSLAHGTARSQE
jgi:hypothetical protein